MSKVDRISPALLSGLLCGLAYPLWIDVPSGFLMWFGLVPLFLSLKNANTFKMYFAKTFVFILISGLIFSHFVMYSGFKNWIFSYLLQPMLMFIPFLIHFYIQKKIGWHKALWILPFVWTFSDWLQHLVPHSFQISSIAYTQTTVIWFAQMADIFGMWGITFWLIIVNVSITIAADNLFKNNIKKPNNAPLSILSIFLKKWALQGAILFGLPLLYAYFSYQNLPFEKHIKVALVQTNEDSYVPIGSTLFEKRLQTVIRLANDAAKSEPDLIVLPESALPLPIMSNDYYFKILRHYVSNWGASLAVGFLEYPDTSNFSKNYNSALVLTPQLAGAWDSLGISTAELKVYRKRNPLPFVEYMPYGFNNGIGINGSEILRGYEPFVFAFPNIKNEEIKTSATICWEQMFPETQAELVENGAQFLTQMNNDGWFSNSTGAAMLLNINCLRAIENRRSIARASNTGISAFIDPFGHIQKILKTNSEVVDTEEMVLNTELTFFTKYKNWFPKLCVIIIIIFYLIWKRPN